MKRNKIDKDQLAYSDEKSDRLERRKERKEKAMERRERRKLRIVDKHGACEYNESQEGRREYGR